MYAVIRIVPQFRILLAIVYTCSADAENKVQVKDAVGILNSIEMHPVMQ